MPLHGRRQAHARQGLRQADHGLQLARGGCDGVPANALVAHGLVGIHQVLGGLICQLWLAACASKGYEVSQLLQRNDSLKAPVRVCLAALFPIFAAAAAAAA